MVVKVLETSESESPLILVLHMNFEQDPPLAWLHLLQGSAFRLLLWTE